MSGVNQYVVHVVESLFCFILKSCVKHSKCTPKHLSYPQVAVTDLLSLTSTNIGLIGSNAAGILHCIHTLYCKPSSCCCTPKLDWNFGSDRQAVFLFYRERCDCCQWGTHSGQHLTRTSCFPSPLPRPAHHYFVWMVALSHVCHTLWLDVKSLL